MTHPEMELEFQDDVLKHKMKQWGIIPSEKESQIQNLSL
jgi:hypothetical protein